MTISVLLAEDDKELNLAITEVLVSANFTVVATDNAESALDEAEKHSFDVALFDLIMPGMTGIEAITTLRRLQPCIGVVISSAFATIDTAVEAMKSGADDFLTKPFNMHTLITMLRRVHAQHQQTPSQEQPDNDKLFMALANPIRRAVLQQLHQHKRLRFMDLCRLTGVENHTQFNFHLRQLKLSGLVEQSGSKIYFLTTSGQHMALFTKKPI
jgi:DNA-binding NtrC family response regulator